MDRPTAELNIGFYFTAFNLRCQVTRVAVFSGVLHYGFLNVDERLREPHCGWIPVAMIGGCELTK
jgi:hypothetical protein